eukprot:15455555-Alexandrium_andersonii.AAC.1
MGFLVGVFQARPTHLSVLSNRSPLGARTLRPSRPRSALAIQLAPAEPVQKWRTRRAPILPAQGEELQTAVDQ